MRILLLSALAVALAGCFLWRDDDVIDPPAELEKFESTLDVRRVWNARVGKGTERLRLGLAPATDGARIYAAAHNGEFSAFDTKTGKRYWTVDTDLALSAGPGVYRGLAVAGSSDGDLVALDTRDGTERWRRRVTGEVLAAPAVSENVVVVRTVDGRVRGLSSETGEDVWTYAQSVPPLSLRGTASPVIVDDLVVCGFDNGKVTALSLGSGDLVWEEAINVARGRTELEKLSDINAAVTVVDRDVYAASYQGRAAMLAVESGRELWGTDISSYSPVEVAGGSLFITTDLSEVVALRGNDRATLWRQEALLRRDLTGPVSHGPAVVVGDFEGFLHWLSKEDGSLVARVNTGSDAVSNRPLVVDGILFALDDGSGLNAYRIGPDPDKSKGRKRKKVKPEAEVEQETEAEAEQDPEAEAD